MTDAADTRYADAFAAGQREATAHLKAEIAALRAQVEEALVIADAHGSCKASWRECMPSGHDLMFGPDIARHWKSRALAAESDAANWRLLTGLVNRCVEVTIFKNDESPGSPKAFALAVVSPECQQTYFSTTIGGCLAEELEECRRAD